VPDPNNIPPSVKDDAPVPPFGTVNIVAPTLVAKFTVVKNPELLLSQLAKFKLPSTSVRSKWPSEWVVIVTAPDEVLATWSFFRFICDQTRR